MVEKSGEYLLQRFYHANIESNCVLALCCVSWCCVCGVRCEVVMKLLIHMKNTNIKIDIRIYSLKKKKYIYSSFYCLYFILL